MISKWPKLSLICQKWPQSHPKPPNMTPKWLRVHTRAVKIVKKQSETSVFENGPSYAKHEQSDPQIIQKSAQSDPKPTPKCAKWPQSDVKATPTRPRVIPNWHHNDPQSASYAKVESKVWSQSAPILPSDAQSNAGHSLNWPQGGAKVKSIIQI